MSRRTIPVFVLAIAALPQGCGQPNRDPQGPGRQAGWTEIQRIRFDSALRGAREGIYRQLLAVRVTPETRLSHLVASKLVSSKAFFGFVSEV